MKRHTVLLCHFQYISLRVKFPSNICMQEEEITMIIYPYIINSLSTQAPATFKNRWAPWAPGPLSPWALGGPCMVPWAPRPLGCLGPQGPWALRPMGP
jgi:hypothetical protein